ncbi:bifunctional diaminohydroxyphosphoribosylaminopyrimidine deaminase/5-amino-6-(5-phosphoribosylamino)uracil reductase RibD [Chryseolinea sp. H1M3-3]|uniref:bifunctional diaminohydroxyphosphoribosylaminopyrimidine deaminase/5-amino-6-(5-phosphoribosylamino)uracil reductase RibD n=1 Tax=Chryseolinea sp. H1M3-3 TaxID=3034144 RepID=UPI0023EDB8B0|nr:bifunctional diaminohydroxyphosphoribosylaminopyrimidine deaminase/5-amino-6-(5-phosphoribosylamino)uracil reductase RibD [Chryseolinea sp. H1M3-3]
MTKHDHHTDELFMQRAMELAQLGIGHVSPNPLVGSIVVHEGKIIGEGWHQKYGGPHAEVNAVSAVADKSLLRESTVYVTLEPCSHFGKTPPCCDMLIQHKVKKVVVANVDSNPVVNGEGLHKLRDAGVEVITGVLEKKGRELNKRFFTFVEKQKPYIILKWAETADGFVARKNYDSKWISDEFSRQFVHKWRTEEDAVLVGMRTAQYDNPQLNVRDWTGRNPVRIVVDRFLKLNKKINLFDGSQKTWCYNVLKHQQLKNISFIRIDEENFLPNLLKDLYRRQIQSVIVEGGAQTLQAFIDQQLWDEARIFISPQTFETGIKAPAFSGVLDNQYKIKRDWLNVYRNPIHS